MKPFNTYSTAARRAAHLASLLCVFALGACSALSPAASTPPAFYALGGPPDGQPTVAANTGGSVLPTLIVNPPRAAAGFDSQRIIFVRGDHQLEYFARSEWVDLPTRMLGPLMVSTLEKTGTFGAVVLTPASASGELRLDTEIVRLQHNFQSHPSRAQFTLRAYLLDDKTRRVLAWKEFRGEAPATSETPQGGVAAANVAVQDVLAQLAQFLSTRPPVKP